MVVDIGVFNAESNRNRVEESRGKMVPHGISDFVESGLKGCALQQRGVGSSVPVGPCLGQKDGPGGVQAVQGDGHIGGGAAGRGIQNVGGQFSGHVNR